MGLGRGRGIVKGTVSCISLVTPARAWDSFLSPQNIGQGKVHPNQQTLSGLGREQGRCQAGAGIGAGCSLHVGLDPKGMRIL